MSCQQHFTVIAATDLFDDVVLALDDYGGQGKFSNFVDRKGFLLVLAVVLVVRKAVVLLVVVEVGMKIVEAVAVEIVVIEIEIAAIEITVRRVG